jgi:hypothetical protein
MTGFAFPFTLVTNKTDLTTMTRMAIAIIVTRTNIGGTAGIGTIIGTIMIETTTEIDTSRLFSAIVDFLVGP